jgi:hypothetical protein
MEIGSGCGPRHMLWRSIGESKYLGTHVKENLGIGGQEDMRYTTRGEVSCMRVLGE